MKLNTTSAATVISTPTVTSTFYVTASDATIMCVGKDSVVVERLIAAPGFPVPNIFTPNNDGKNDCIKILFWGKVKNFKLEIYNRWGKQVFSADNINQCWNGTLNGKNAPMGTYVYRLTAINNCNNTLIEKKGTVTVVR